MLHESPFKDLDRSKLMHPPASIAALMKHLAVRDFEGDNRRDSERHMVKMTVVVQPINIEFHPQGEPFVANVRDISASGVSFLLHHAVEHDFLAIELELPGHRNRGTFIMVAEVVRSRAVNNSLFDIGCRFSCRLPEG